MNKGLRPYWCSVDLILIYWYQKQWKDRFFSQNGCVQYLVSFESSLSFGFCHLPTKQSVMWKKWCLLPNLAILLHNKVVNFTTCHFSRLASVKAVFTSNKKLSNSETYGVCIQWPLICQKIHFDFLVLSAQ